MNIAGCPLTITGSASNVTGCEMSVTGNTLEVKNSLLIPKRRVAIIISKVSTGNIDGVFKAQDKLLKDQMDALVQPFQFSHPDFFKANKNARSIVDYTGRGKAAPVTPVAIPV